jgi:NAD-dependent deacetylase
MASKENIVVFTGAGISAESGLRTFRDAGGLWEGYDIMEVASIDGWLKSQETVLAFYNERRAQLLNVHPNPAHLDIQKLEKKYNCHVVTQNVDDLHERAGSSQIIHLHGELKKARSSGNPLNIVDWEGDIAIGDVCPQHFQWRPHIVWFGEEVPMLELAAGHFTEADICLIIGTSLQVYPAAGLVQFCSPDCEIIYVDPKPHLSYELSRHKKLKVYPTTAVEGMKEVLAYLGI